MGKKGVRNFMRQIAVSSAEAVTVVQKDNPAVANAQERSRERPFVGFDELCDVFRADVGKLGDPYNGEFKSYG